jgi:hypothetical protein
MKEPHWLYTTPDSEIAWAYKIRFARRQAMMVPSSYGWKSVLFAFLSIMGALWFDTTIYGPYFEADLGRVWAIILSAAITSIVISWYLGRDARRDHAERKERVFLEECEKLNIDPHYPPDCS